MPDRPTRGLPLDLLIAATALSNELPLYTQNPEDFSSLTGILDVFAVAPAGD